MYELAILPKYSNLFLFMIISDHPDQEAQLQLKNRSFIKKDVKH